MDEAKAGDGIVSVELGDEPVELRPTLGAAQQLSRQGGGLMGMIERCARLDIDAISLVFQHGMGLTANGMKHANVQERIYQHGLDYCGGRAIKFLRILANGGRDEEPEAADTMGEQRRATA